jgi:aminopeptidase YwaD
MNKSLGFLILLFPFLTEAQHVKRADKLLIKNLEKHINFLASDSQEVRQAGSIGVLKVVDYITGEYQKLGLTPMGENGYIQTFPIDEGKIFAANAYLSINNQKLQENIDFFPLSNSGSGEFKSQAAIVLNEAKQVWFNDLNDILDENKSNPHFDLIEWLSKRVIEVKGKGATALLLFNSGTINDNIEFNKYDTNSALTLPVIYFTKEGFAKYFADETGTYEVDADIQFEHPTSNAYNVLAYINNNAANTVILGAHMDHLGYNQDKNVSGTAALIELAKNLSKKSLNHNNYLIIHFSGQALGLLSSKYWLAHPNMNGKCKIFDIMSNKGMRSSLKTIDKAMFIIKKSEEELKFDL